MKPPIAEPFEPALDREQWRTFPIRFWRFFVLTLAGGLIGALPIVWLLLGNQSVEVQRVAITAGLGAGVAATLLISALTCHFLPAKVNDRKLKSINAYYLEQEVEWSQIHKVRFFWFFLPYAIISTPKKRNFIWVPLFLRDMNGFARAVEEVAPEENPLRLFLQKRGF